uniref:G-protein coupled receptors family 1 profile domain-containing protein n=1 Tax=Branchiostoma floridae TaxID=7739 RepID=C3Z5E3_BRAFL|eukprot:XP_002596044.1 hypothetical protein BRAFLDRAFT_66226 [Branchiostoma floridae]
MALLRQLMDTQGIMQTDRHRVVYLGQSTISGAIRLQVYSAGSGSRCGGICFHSDGHCIRQQALSNPEVTPTKVCFSAESISMTKVSHTILLGSPIRRRQKVWREVLSLGPFACKFIPLAQGVAVGASVFTLMAIAYDRYRLVIHPSQNKAPVKYWSCILAGVWVSAISIMVPQAVVREEISHMLPGGDIKVCLEFWPSYTQRQAYSAALLACCYLGPLVISACLYLMVAVTLRRRKITNNTMHASQRFNKVTKMLVIVIVLFTLSWIPLYTCWMVEDFGKLTGSKKLILHDYVYPFAHWLAFSNSCVNPLLYGYFNKSLRKRFRDSLVRKSDNEITGGNISLKIKASVNRKAILKYRRNSNK